jgi:orotate phosphoribosyltransferase
MNNAQRDRLLQLLFERSFRYRPDQPFKLISGRTSPFYIDCKTVSLDPEGAFLIGELVFDRIKTLPVDGVGGMTLGADPIATAVSLTSYLKGKPIAAFIVRKEQKGHGSGLQIEGSLAPSSRVVVVEDVVTTGGSTEKTIEVLKKAGHEIVRVIALVDRKEGGGERLASLGHPLESLFTIDDLMGLHTLRSSG